MAHVTDLDRSVLDIEERAAGVREFRFAAARRKAPWQVGKASWQVGKAP
jgi:hypothetical protein